MKLEHSPAIDPRTGWMEAISRDRLNVEDLLQDSPSLGVELGPMIENPRPRVARLAAASLFGYGETVPSYTEDQALGDWFPEASPPP